MPWDGSQTCTYLFVEAERLLDEGQVAAARLLFNRVADTCLFERHPCPRAGTCRTAADRVARRLDATVDV
ncbi:hypothetical protein CKO21_14705 [Rhodovibrio salinarum]|uniref:Uncharacterized protein n=1 Tax=Rhodovibrio salinarum TaxID=1087 RepID=A0A934QKC3_9PROT|nr:hypothetical protein [Rhodovibrio salinarum]